jgi:hypothetical protein
VKPWFHVVAGFMLAGATSLLGVCVWFRISRWRRKTPEELERLRRLEVNHRGRITAGHIVDLIEHDRGERLARFVVYHYEVAGVTYEASQDVTALPDAFTDAHSSTDQPANVKYDPRKPTNSIIVCEEWSGIRAAARTRRTEGGAQDIRD